jgi:hypothetical protein
MALSTENKTVITTALSAMEARGRLSRGTASAWSRSKTRKATKAATTQAEISRLKAKVNRLVAAQDEALLHLASAKAYTTPADVKKAQARITKAIKQLAV